MRTSSFLFMALVLMAVCSARAAAPNQNPSATAHSSPTLFADCQDKERPKHLFSSTSISEDRTWRAYVEVEIRPDLGCAHTTRLWVAKANQVYRVLYLMPPKRYAVENGMEILGWARHSRMLLVRTEEWQYGSDAPDTQQVLAIDGRTGVVYEPDLDGILEARKDKQCWFRISDAGFSKDQDVVILIRGQISTFYDVDETQVDDVPASKRCEKTEETWSFNFANGEVKQVSNSEPLELFKKTEPHR